MASANQKLQRILFEDFFDTRESAILNDSLISSNLKKNIVTVDFEWTNKLKTDTSKISLVQIGLRNELILVFDVLKSPQYLDEFLKYIFQDYNLMKIVLSDHDARVLLENGIFMVNTIDVQQVYKNYCTLLEIPESSGGDSGGLNELCSILKILNNPFKNSDEDKYWMWSERPLSDDSLDYATYDAWCLWEISFGLLKLILRDVSGQYDDNELDNLVNSSDSSICKFEKGFVGFHRKVGNCYKTQREQIEKNARDNSDLFFKYDINELGYFKYQKFKGAESSNKMSDKSSIDSEDNKVDVKAKTKVKVKVEEEVGWCSWFMKLLGKFVVLIIIVSLVIPLDSPNN